jgi:hypothetical protein
VGGGRGDGEGDRVGKVVFCEGGSFGGDAEDAVYGAEVFWERGVD